MANYDYTNTMVWEMGCPHIWPHPGLTNLEFGRVYITFQHSRSAGTLSVEWRKTVGVNPG